MQRIEIVKEVAKHSGVERGTVKTILEAFMTSIVDHTIKREHVSLSGFGRFYIKKRAAKMGRNINNNTPLKIPPYSAPVFKPSKKFILKVKKAQAKINITAL